MNEGPRMSLWQRWMSVYDSGRESAGMKPVQILGKKNHLLQIGLMSLGLLCAGISALPAGDFEIVWTAVQDEQLKGYRLHYGQSSRAYDRFVDLDATASSHTLTGLADCQTWYAALTSIDQEDLQSLPSEEISGFTQPRINSMRPDVILAGTTSEINLEGISFEGTATVAVPGAQVVGVQVESCRRIKAIIQVAAAAPAGPLGVQVMNPGSVPAESAAILLVVTDPGPVPALVQPGEGEQEVPVGVAPRIEFDRDLLPSSISALSIRLLDEAGLPVPQAAGSPSLMGRVVTIQPAVLLRQAARYRIEVLGGTTGVRDAAGAPMASDFRQGGGFLIVDLPPSMVPRVRRTDTKPPS